MESQKYIKKQLAGKEDLLTGVGFQEQERFTGTKVITKLNASHLEGAIIVDTIKDLIELDIKALKENPKVYVLGYHQPNDGGEGLFIWDSEGDKGGHNGGIVIDPNKLFPDWNNEDSKNSWFNVTNNGKGVWKRIYSGAVNVEWFGAKGDGVTDDTKAIQKAINVSKKLRTTLFFEQNHYIYNAPIFPECSYVTFLGNSLEQTIIEIKQDLQIGFDNNNRTKSTIFDKITFQGNYKLTFRAMDRLRLINCKFATNECILHNNYENKFLFTRFDPTSLIFKEDETTGEGTYDTSIIGCAFYGAQWNIQIKERVESIQITDCWIEISPDNNVGGILLGDNSTSPNGWQGINISNNHFAPYKQIKIMSANGSFWEHLTIANNTFSANINQANPFMDIRGGLRRSYISNNRGYGTNKIPYAIDIERAIFDSSLLFNNKFDIGGNNTYSNPLPNTAVYVQENMYIEGSFSTRPSYLSAINIPSINSNVGSSDFRLKSDGSIICRKMDASKQFIIEWETNSVYSYPAMDLGKSNAKWNTLYINNIVSNLPTSDPGVAGQLWNDNGTVKISAG